MANNFKRGQKLYFPFSKTYGETILNAHLMPRYYKSKEAYDHWVTTDPDVEMVEYGEIKHGNWVEKEEDERHYCSVCGRAAFITLIAYPEYDYNLEEELEFTGRVEYEETEVLTLFCPYCGVEMGEKE